MTQNHKKSPTDDGAEPGAERFWGEFARAGSARRTGAAGDAPENPGQDQPGEPAGGAGGGRQREGPDPDRTSAGDPGIRHTQGHGECLEWCPICRSAELFRNAVTPELREQAETLQREALNIFHAFLAAYSERTGGTEPAGPGGRRDAGKPEGDPDSRGGPSSAGRPEPDRGSSREVTDIPLD